jgi:hypothetical protein
MVVSTLSIVSVLPPERGDLKEQTAAELPAASRLPAAVTDKLGNTGGDCGQLVSRLNR